MFLHAAVLDFPHPLTGERVRVESPLPADLERYVGSLDAAAEGAGESAG
jgi:hypothetical protein